MGGWEGGGGGGFAGPGEVTLPSLRDFRGGKLRMQASLAATNTIQGLQLLNTCRS